MIDFGTLVVFDFARARPTMQFVTAPKFHQAGVLVRPVAVRYFFMGLFGIFVPSFYFADRVAQTTLLLGVAAAACIRLSRALLRQGGLAAALALAGEMAAMLPSKHTSSRAHAHWLHPGLEVPRIARFVASFGGIVPTLLLFSLPVSLQAGCLGALGPAVAMEALDYWVLAHCERAAVLSVARRATGSLLRSERS